jgi:hypothetical protein
MASRSRRMLRRNCSMRRFPYPKPTVAQGSVGGGFAQRTAIAVNLHLNAEIDLTLLKAAWPRRICHDSTLQGCQWRYP